MFIHHSCPKCGGSMSRQQNNDHGLAVVYEWHCFTCGNVITNEQMKDIIYEKNFEALSLKKMTENMTEKCQISLGELKENEKEEEKTMEQPVIPVKVPNTDGMGLREKGRVLGKFYEEHKTEIVEDMERLGKEKARKRWQIPSQTFINLRRKWGMPVDGKYARHVKDEARLRQGSDTQAPKLPLTQALSEFAKSTPPAVRNAAEAVKEESKPVNGESISKEDAEYIDKLPVDYGAIDEILSKSKLIAEKSNNGADDVKVPAIANIHVTFHKAPLLPAFPEFKDSWSETTQIEWFRIYGKITTEVRR